MWKMWVCSSCRLAAVTSDTPPPPPLPLSPGDCVTARDPREDLVVRVGGGEPQRLPRDCVGKVLDGVDDVRWSFERAEWDVRGTRAAPG